MSRQKKIHQPLQPHSTMMNLKYSLKRCLKRSPPRYVVLYSAFKHFEISLGAIQTDWREYRLFGYFVSYF
jgi:hypothetical protein